MARYAYGDRDVSYQRTAYLEGTAARELQDFREWQEMPETGRKTRNAGKSAKSSQMSLGYVAFLVLALAFAVMTLLSYIRLQAEVTDSVKAISAMEREYNTLKMTNDETYARIVSSINLEDVKAVAIGELGMEYAAEGQIVVISDHQSDYVRQEGNLK